MVDFAGGPLTALAKEDRSVEAVVSVSSGTVSATACYSNKAEDSWRAIFDFAPTTGEPVDIRLYLKKNDTPLTETWLYQFISPRRTG